MSVVGHPARALPAQAARTAPPASIRAGRITRRTLEIGIVVFMLALLYAPARCSWRRSRSTTRPSWRSLRGLHDAVVHAALTTRPSRSA